jgi:hypothetical protein
MQKQVIATKAHTATIVQILQTDIANYVALTQRAFSISTQQEDYVAQQQFTDTVYVYNALVNFMQNKNVTQLCNTILKQDTFVRDKFYNVVRYATDNYLYV